MSGNFYDTGEEGLTGFREEVAVLVEGNHLYVIPVVVKVKNSGKLVLKTRVVVVEDHPVAASQHDQVGGNCKGNPFRFRFRFRLPPAFRFRSRHLVSLPQRIRTNDVLRHPLPTRFRSRSRDVA